MPRALVAMVFVLAALAGSDLAFGQLSWSDSFPGGVPQQSWSLAANGPAGASQTYGSGFTTLSGNGAGAVFATVAAPVFSGSTGVTVRATLNPTQSTQNVANGVLAATNLTFGSAYTATITMGGSGFLEIQRNNFGTAAQLASSGSAFTPGFSGLNTYLLELIVFPNSSRIVANAYDSTGSTLLNSISAVDPSPLTGNYTAGILMQRNDAGTVQGTFGDVQAVGVPEPSTVMLAAGGLGLLGVGGWFRRRAARRAARPPRHHLIVGQTLLAVALVGASAASVLAQQTWSANGSTPGGAGTWTAAGSNWLPGPAAWSAGQTGVFSGVSGTITLPTSINVSSGLRFDADGFRVTFSSAGDLGNNFVFANALNLQGTPTMEAASGAVGTVATLLTGSGGFTKTGQGSLNLVNPFSTFSGNVVVNEGTLIAGGNGVPAAAGAGLFGYHNGNNSALGQLSGGAAASRQIVVNAAGTLNFIGDDTFGDRVAAITPVTIVANGGLITNGPVVNNNGTPVNTGFQGAFNLLGPVQLNGGTMRSTWGKFKPSGADADYPGFQAFAFRSTVTSSGNSTIESQLNQAPAFGGFHLGGALADPNPTFNVTDGTLTVSAVLLDKPSSMASEAGGSRDNIRSGFTKSGAGTMILSGTNEYTGNTTLSGGTLQLAAGGVLRFAANTTTGLFNSIGGSAGSLDLAGTLFFDLANASTVPGTIWNIVNGASIDETYGASFAVSSSLGSFTGDGGVWTLFSGGNTWTFEQSGGTLSFVPEPSGFALAIGAVAAGLVAVRRRRPRGHCR